MWQVYEADLHGEIVWVVARSEDDMIAVCASPNAAERVAGAMNREKPVVKLFEVS